MEVIIREHKVDDLEQVYKLELECFKSPYSLKHLMYEFNENPINKFIVLEFNGKIIGFIDYIITFNSASINQICVDKEYRRNNLAKKMLKYMEDSFPKEGDEIVEAVTLEVRESNEAAIKLYESFGYEYITDKKAYYPDGESARYYVKRLF